jgi:pyruvate/2-oxoglutarate/acetoin dehydrogenase E1 component
MTTTVANAIHDALDEVLTHDSGVVVVGESVRATPATRGLREKHGEDRVIEVPIADRAAVALGLGLAVAGRRPFVELAGTGRLLAALETLAEAASIAKSGEFAVPLVIRVASGDEAGPRIDRAIGALLAAIPGLTVACVSTPAIAGGLIRAASAASSPIVLFEPRSQLAVRGDVGDVPWPIGKARIIREGRHVTIAAFGSAVEAASQAADSLAADGIECDVIDLVTLSPIDARLGERVMVTGRLVLAGTDRSLCDALLATTLGAPFEYLEAVPTATDSDAASIAAGARSSVSW